MYIGYKLRFKRARNTNQKNRQSLTSCTLKQTHNWLWKRLCACSPYLWSSSHEAWESLTDRYSFYSFKILVHLTSLTYTSAAYAFTGRVHSRGGRPYSAFFACLGYVQGLISLLYWHFEGVSQVGINKTNFWIWNLRFGFGLVRYSLVILFVDISLLSRNLNVSLIWLIFFLLCVLWLHSLIFFAWTHRLLLDLC